MKSYENSLRNYKYLVTNSSTNTEKKFKTTIEITDQYKIPKSTIYHILWGRECQKWNDFRILKINEKSYRSLEQ